MRRNVNRIYAVVLVSLLVSAAFCSASISIVGTIATKTAIGSSDPPYDAWADVNNDGIVNVLDLIAVAIKLGGSGTPLQKALLKYEFDSGWVNVTGVFNGGYRVGSGLNAAMLQYVHDMLVDARGRIPGWNKTYGGIGGDYGESMVRTSDGGYALAGYTNSSGAGGYDFYLVKTDVAGNVQWSRTYGGKNVEQGYSVIQTSDGGYALAGLTISFGAGSDDAYLVKTDSSGNMQWNKTYGGVGSEYAFSVVQTSDGGYALAGETYLGPSSDDAYLVKTDSSGNMQWSKTYGGAKTDRFNSIVRTRDGGYALTGFTYSFGAGIDDVYLVKTDSSGNLQWNKTFGGTGYDGAYSLVQTSDNGYVLTGSTTSFGASNGGVYLVKTGSSGNLQWNKTYGNNVLGQSVIQTSDGGYAVAGWTTAASGGTGIDAYLVKTDGTGNMQWSKNYGGRNGDFAQAVLQTSDGGYILAGTTYSYGSGKSDFWLIKADFESGLAWIVNPTANTLTLYRGATDPYWSFIRVRIWVPETP